jgi:osmotically-inducible protein OsmY
MSIAVADDRSLEDKVRTRLDQSGYAAMRSIACRVEAGCIRLSGRTRTYYLKQMAQELARATPGAQEIANEIRVALALRDDRLGDADGP